MNLVALAGSVGNFEVKKIASKKGDMLTVCNISLAVSQKDKSTMWVNLLTFNEGLIEKVIIPYLSKGSKIAVQGSLNIREYTNKENIKKQSTEVIIDNLTLMGSSKKSIEEQLASANA